MQYRQLYSLTIRHAYYKDGNCTDFTLAPTPACEALLRNFRLLLKPSPGGLRVLAPCLTNGKLFQEIPGNIRFGFYLKNDNPHFNDFTDLEKTFGGTVPQNPVFLEANWPDLDGSFVPPESIEMTRSALPLIKLTDAIKFTYTGASDVPKIKVTRIANIQSTATENPNITFTEGAGTSTGEDQLSATIQLKGTAASASPELFLSGWTAYENDHPDTKFKLEPIPNPLPASPNLSGLATTSPGNERDFNFEPQRWTGRFPADDPANHFKLTYNRTAGDPVPVVRVKRDAMPDDKKVMFNPQGPELEITFPPNLSLIFKSEILNAWNEVTDKGKFVLELIGRIPKTFQTQELTASHTDHFTVPADVPNLLEPIPFILRNKPTASDINSFLLDGPTGIERNRFNAEANVALVDAPGQQGRSFSLTYPVRPALPWGVWGQVELVSPDPVTAPPDPEIDLVIRMEPKAIYWKYYLISPLDFDVAEAVLPAAPLPPGADIPVFLIRKIPAGMTESGFTSTLGALKTAMGDPDFNLLWEQVQAIEDRLPPSEKAIPNRLLFVSGNRVPLKEKYSLPLKLKLTRNMDLDLNTDVIDPFGMELTLPPPQRDETRVIRVGQPFIIPRTATA